MLNQELRQSQLNNKGSEQEIMEVVGLQSSNMDDTKLKQLEGWQAVGLQSNNREETRGQENQPQKENSKVSMEIVGNTQTALVEDHNPFGMLAGINTEETPSWRKKVGYQNQILGFLRQLFNHNT